MSVAVEVRKSLPRRRTLAAASISASIWPIAPGESIWTHHVALIETAWGMAGVRWRVRSDVQPFLHDGSNEALLTRIIPPGLAARQLREALTAEPPSATEIFADAHGQFHLQAVPHWFGELRDVLISTYAAGLRDGVPAPAVNSRWQTWRARLDFDAITPFQARVLETVAAIPRGQTRTYAQIAEALGKPRAARAVGTALAANPWPVLIPCHRVVGSSGAMTGFTAPGGVRSKRRMLLLEAALQQSDEPFFDG